MKKNLRSLFKGFSLWQLIQISSPYCTGLPRHFVPRNDGAHNRHCKGVSPWQSSTIRHKDNIKPKAFSLIELVISLLVISVIIAAFTPIITSKLKHREITFADKKIKIDCTKFGDECLACDDSRCTICRTSFGVPDGKFVNPEDGCHLQNCSTKFGGACSRCIKEYCQSCSSGYGFNETNKKNTNACTICNAGYISNGGTNTCSACPAGTAQPSTGKNSCNPCSSDYYSAAGASSCTKCSNSFGGCSSCNSSGCSTCWTGYYLSGTTCYQRICAAGFKVVYSPNNAYCDACSGNTYQSNNNYSGTSCNPCGTNQAANAAHTGCYSTCVSAASCGANQALIDGCHCSTCSSGTTPNAAKTSCVAIAAPTPTPTPVNCPDGTYKSGSTCPSCTTFHSKCSKCAENGCSECSEGYIAVNGKCNKKVTQTDCSNKFDGFWDGFNKICVTKRNMGYSANGSSSEKYKEIPIPTEAGVSSAKIESKCSKATTDTEPKCCWYGTTGDTGVNTATNSSDLTAKNGSTAVSPAYTYSASKRTVCNWYAAKAICRTYSGGGAVGYWRLPTREEIKGWAANGDSISSGLGANGLQLCDREASGYGAPRCGYRDSKCKYNNTVADCYPAYVWGSMDPEGTVAIAELNLGRVYAPTSWPMGVFSTRCVIDNYPSD